MCTLCRSQAVVVYIHLHRWQLCVRHCVIWSIKTYVCICGNEMLTRCNRGFYCRSYCLLNMFRASLCPSSGAQEYYTVVAACGILCCGFSSSWSGVELRVMRPVCRMLVYCLCFVACTLELLMMGIVMPETC